MLSNIIKEIYVSSENEGKNCQAIISKSFKDWIETNQCTSVLRDTIKKFEDIN